MQLTPTELLQWAAQFYPTVQQQQQRMILVPYAYTVSFASLAAGATATTTLAITANADFIHLNSSFRASAAGAVQNVGNVPMPQMRLLITDSGSNEQFTNAPADLLNYCPTVTPSVAAQHDYPRIIAGRSTLTLALTSYEAAQAYSVDLFLAGVLVRLY